jgi:general secretion pathway protein D
MDRFIPKVFIVITLTLLLLGSVQISAEEAAGEDNQSMTLNMNKTDIRALIETMSNITGKNFIVDPRVSGEVTVISSASVSPEEAYEIFVSVLRVHGYSIVPSGQALKVIPNMNAKQSGVPTVEERRVNDDLINRVVRIKHSQANQLIPILRPLLPQEAHLAAHPTSNTLLITDTASNINRILEIVSSLDIKQDSEIEIVLLENTQASDLVNIIQQIQKKGSAQNEPFRNQNTFTADNRTNSIILNGSFQWRKDLKQLIFQLDRPTDKSDDTEVIFLKHATAKDILGVIQNIGMHQIQSQNKGKGAASAINQQFDVQADDATNALIVTASPLVAKTIKRVITQLDIRRAQVHIQAIIAEVNYDKAMELGIEWASTEPGTNESGFKSNITWPVAEGSTPFGYALGNGFSLGYVTNGALTALIKAIASDDDTNILSTPSIVTLDNEEASIVVGQNIPIVTGRYTGTSDTDTGVNPFQTIERQDVGIKLKVKPNINEGDTIKLNIEQEVSDVSSTSPDGIETSTREIKTTVIVDDSEIIVLGGLIKDKIEDGTSKVPLLGDLPLVGNLFRSSKSSLNKQNLMVFLVPRIIRNNEDNKVITSSQYDKMRSLQLEARNAGITLLDENLSPLLPEDPATLELLNSNLEIRD